MRWHERSTRRSRSVGRFPQKTARLHPLIVARSSLESFPSSRGRSAESPRHGACPPRRRSRAPSDRGSRADEYRGQTKPSRPACRGYHSSRSSPTSSPALLAGTCSHSGQPLWMVFDASLVDRSIDSGRHVPQYGFGLWHTLGTFGTILRNRLRDLVMGARPQGVRVCVGPLEVPRQEVGVVFVMVVLQIVSFPEGIRPRRVE